MSGAMRPLLALLAGLAACRAGPRPLVDLRVEPGAADTRLVLVAAPGWRINALLKPALERPDGSVLRFDADRLPADSAYFAAPPEATLPGRRIEVRGTLRASVCADGEQVCRAYVREVRSKQ